jgi:hypothetical protein
MGMKIRKHTIIVTRDDENAIIGLMLEKDWYSQAFANAYEQKTLEERPQGQFWFLSQNCAISQAQARLFTDNILNGKITVIDLREFSINVRKNGRK